LQWQRVTPTSNTVKIVGMCEKSGFLGPYRLGWGRGGVVFIDRLAVTIQPAKVTGYS